MNLIIVTNTINRPFAMKGARVHSGYFPPTSVTLMGINFNVKKSPNNLLAGK